MKIERVRAFLLSCPLPEPLVLPFYGGERTILKRDAMLIRVEAENGLTGYGPGPAHEAALRVIEDVIGPFLAGRQLKDLDALRVMFLQQPFVTLDVSKIWAAVEIALYDLTARAFSVPVCDLLGGSVRSEIRLYGSGGMYMPPQQYAEEAAAILDMGFTAYKFRPGLGPDQDLEIVRRMRETVGDVPELMVDAHTWWRMGDRSYSEQTVHQLAKELGNIGVTWLEEPLPPHDHDAYARLKAADLVPLASGEHEPDPEGYADLIALEAVDFVQMDLVCQGGYHYGRQLLATLARAGLPFAFHSWGTSLEALAAAHLGVCWPDSVTAWLEYPCYKGVAQPGMYPFALAEDILMEPLPITRGTLELDLSRPGLGIDVNMAAVERFPWIPGPWSFFRLDSPAEIWAVTGDHSLRWADGESASEQS